MQIDPWILAFSAVTVIVTIWMGFRSAKTSKTASDFFVAGRSVSVGWNASAISGEYLSAASFMGVAGMVMSSGYDALWYPVCYACGYLFLLLFIAGPLRRFGAYTIPDFAEGRFDSPLFRKIAVVFVLFIGFFYTMPQMKGAGTTLAYIFPGLPYWAGVVLVGAVITLNVALGGMKGITLVQAFQYWIKMFAISVPIFVLMAVYGHYGRQLNLNARSPIIQKPSNVSWFETELKADSSTVGPISKWLLGGLGSRTKLTVLHPRPVEPRSIAGYLQQATAVTGTHYVMPNEVASGTMLFGHAGNLTNAQIAQAIEGALQRNPSEWQDAQGRRKETLVLIRESDRRAYVVPGSMAVGMTNRSSAGDPRSPEFKFRFVTPPEVIAVNGKSDELTLARNARGEQLEVFLNSSSSYPSIANGTLLDVLNTYAEICQKEIAVDGKLLDATNRYSVSLTQQAKRTAHLTSIEQVLKSNGIAVIHSGVPKLFALAKLAATSERDVCLIVALADSEPFLSMSQGNIARASLPEKAPADATWINPFGPLTTKAAKAASSTLGGRPGAIQWVEVTPTSFTPDNPLWRVVDQVSPLQKTFYPISTQLFSVLQLASNCAAMSRNSYWVSPELADKMTVPFGYTAPLTNAQYVATVHATLTSHGAIAHVRTNGRPLIVDGQSVYSTNRVMVIQESNVTRWVTDTALQTVSASDAQKAWLAKHEKPLALLYTYSLIIAIVCGTAGLPHILVRFYTNPDGVAAKRTTMWVMILIGVFYVFPPVFGVIGRNLLPELYSGVGAKGTDKIVLELPRIISERYGVLGSILSGITCAGAFAAFMSTFSGLLVSMTGALAHDVYGRMLNPKASAEQRMKMFKWCAVLIGGVAVLLGSQVEPLQINFMVGQAFAIAAASYFPLLFMAVWWRKLTMKGAATGMLTGGLLALAGISLTSFTDLKWLPLDSFWAAHPLLRILCEQPAIWAVPLAIILMVIVSKLTSKDVPEDIRMKMLVLHAPEKLGLKQEYIQEHQHGH